MNRSIKISEQSILKFQNQRNETTNTNNPVGQTTEISYNVILWLAVVKRGRTKDARKIFSRVCMNSRICVLNNQYNNFKISEQSILKSKIRESKYITIKILSVRHNTVYSESTNPTSDKDNNPV